MNKQEKKICLITPNHIATNPRLVKEAIAFEKSGFKVHLIFTLEDKAGWEKDQTILDQHPAWSFNAFNWSGNNFRSSLARFKSGLVKKMAERLFRLKPSGSLAVYIVNRNYKWQVKKAAAAKADLYIAHNLGALPVAKEAANRAGGMYGFDAEDFHRNETSDDPTDEGVRIKSVVEEMGIPGVQYCTAASPLIGEAYQRLFPSIHPTTILNVFPKINKAGSKRGTEDKTIKLFWFSQTIGANRGLETIVQAIGKSVGQKFELHLLGKQNKQFLQKLNDTAARLGLEKNLHFYDPVPEAEIFSLAATCDIGLASETGVPLNRDICLTNKIFTYIQSGLAVLATDTTAQIAFMQSYPEIGQLYKKDDAESLAGKLDFYYNNQLELEQCKGVNFALGQTILNWEVEQKKLVESIDKLWN